MPAFRCSQTELNERDAFRAVFSFQQTLDGLNPADVPNLDKAKLNVWEFVHEVVERLKAWRRAVGKKRRETIRRGRCSMSTRVNPFANLNDPPVFATKPKKETPVEKETIARIAEQNNFPSRQAPKAPKVERRKPRTHQDRPQSAVQRQGNAGDDPKILQSGRRQTRATRRTDEAGA